MFPSQLFSLFPPFPRVSRVFVAMSFAEYLNRRWQDVIAPAIRAVSVGGVALEPHRVDTRTVNDSILTEILDGVSSDRLVFGDVSELGKLEDSPIRNANVMYEIGLAHAVRLPEEVLLFRSDDSRLLFDVATIRVTRYDPDGEPSKAREQVADALVNALKEVDLRRHKAVQAAAQSIGFEGWVLLAEASSGLKHPVVRTMRDVMNQMGRRVAIPRLLDLGLIKTQFPKWTPDMPREVVDGPIEVMFQYTITPFGEAVLKASAEMLGITPHNLEQFRALFEQSGETIGSKPPES